MRTLSNTAASVGVISAMAGGILLPVMIGQRRKNNGKHRRHNYHHHDQRVERVIKHDTVNKINKAKANKEDEGHDHSSHSSSSSSSYLQPHQCALYLAPSSLPGAGLGLYSGAAIPRSHSINEYLGGTFAGHDDEADVPLWTDMVIPLADRCKAYPYRGQERFPSWLGYVWPERRGHFSGENFDITSHFPNVPRELWDIDLGLNDADGLEFYLDDWSTDDEAASGHRHPRMKLSGLSPGLASLANHGPGHLANVDRMADHSRVNYAGQSFPWHAGAGAFTPHHTMEYAATKEVWAGMELLLHYGEEYEWSIAKKMAHWNEMAKKTAEENNEARAAKLGFDTGIDLKWDIMDSKEHGRCPRELPTEKAKRKNLGKGHAFDNSYLEEGEHPYSEYRANNFHPSDLAGEEKDNLLRQRRTKPRYTKPLSPNDITRSLSWLDDHGVCLSSGMLRVDQSSIPHAGRGVFATAPISKGEVVLTSPLLAMRHDDFVIYKSDPSKPPAQVLDKTTVQAHELLLNYAFSHPESPLYLVPTAPLANYINHAPPHGGEGTMDKKKANVEVRWPTKGSNAAKLFSWAYNQPHNSHFASDYDMYSSRSFSHDDDGNNPFLQSHPIDVMERSGKLALEYVALHEIHPNEEILLDYGPLWDAAWRSYANTHPHARPSLFRHPIGVPSDLYPKKWLHTTDKYEIAELADLESSPISPGSVVPLTWAHNGKLLGSKYAYAIGLEKGFSDKFLQLSKDAGIVDLYRKLLTEQEGYHLQSDAFGVYSIGGDNNQTASANNNNESSMEVFAHRYKSKQWNFNMHFVAAWNEEARRSILQALGKAGFDTAVRGLGERFGYDNMTCFHASYMGMTHCDSSVMHSDIYATGDKSWNIIFPLITVEGTDPELNIMAENMNTIVGVHYLKDVAYAMGDFGYHQTIPSNYFDPKDGADVSKEDVPIRVVFGAYCSQIDESNVAMIRHIYDGDDPAPFADQFVDLPIREIHWDKSTGASLATPGGKGLSEVY